MKKRGITLVLNCHDEGRLAWRSFKAGLAALKKFKASHEKRGAQLLIVCDRTDAVTSAVTQDMLNESTPEVEVWRTTSDHGDLGLARNHGVTQALYDTVAFCDADDIIGESWLERGWEWLQKQDGPTVVHPQVNLNFERDMLFWQHTDSRDPAFDPSVFCVTNHWTALSMAPAELYEAHPYVPAEPKKGTGFEDWEWNTRTMAAGVRHGVVPETVHFIRKRSGSMSDAHASQLRATACNAFWDKRWSPGKVTPVESPRDCGDWLTDEWKAAHEHEAELWPRPRELQHRPLYSPPGSKMEWDAYHLLNECVPAGASHLIFCAGLGGGADLRAAWYAEAVKLSGGEAVLFATDGPLHKLPLGRLAVPAKKVLQTLPPHVQSRVMQRLMRQHRERGRTLHIVNSAPAWGAIGQNPKLFQHRELPKIFASLYARELYPDGSTGGYAFNGAFGAAMQGVDVVVTDNQRMRDDLAKSMGWQGVVVAPTPIALGKRSMRRSGNDKPDAYGPCKVLWASRIDWNKNLELAVEIAKHMGRNVELHVWGLPTDWHGRRAVDSLRQQSNCFWHGPFDSFEKIEGSYDCFLFTSRGEGSPNVVAEAMAHGLPVVSSEAGGGLIVGAGAPLGEWAKAIVDSSNAFERVEPLERPVEALAEPLYQAGYFDHIRLPQHFVNSGAEAQL